jgi:hypothetical protein
MPASHVKLKARLMREDDFAECSSVLSRNGLGAPTREDWHAAWHGHPQASEFADAAQGWVLEHPEGGLVGTLANVHLMLELQGRPLRGCVSASWAVDPEWRGSSIGLMTRFLGQKGIDLLFSLQVSADSARVTGALQSLPVPAPRYDTARFIPVSMTAFAASSLARKGVPAPGLFAPFLAPVLAARFRRRSSAEKGYEVRLLDGFGDEFELLWARLRAEATGLIAWRSRDTLRWRFPQSGDTRILGLFRQGELAGYLVLKRSIRTAHRGLATDLVADWQVASPHSGAAAMLLDAARKTCRDTGGHALEIRGWCGWKQELVGAFRPLETTPGTARSFVRIQDKELRQKLDDPALWDLSPFERF